MPVSATGRRLSVVQGLLLIATMVLTPLQGAVPAMAAPPEAPQPAPVPGPSLVELFGSREPDILAVFNAQATGKIGICSNDKTIACATSADCGGNTCYLPAGGGGQTLGDQICMQQAAGFGINCTANDVNIAATHNLVVVHGCDFPGDTAEISFVAEYKLTAQDRYDIGVWISQDGGDALTGTCSVSDFPIAPTPPWTNLDASAQPTDTCGDITASNNPLFSSVQNIKINCVDTDGNGLADINSCLSWRQSGANDICTSPLQAFPGAPSKCKCQALPGIAITIPGVIIVDKVTKPISFPDVFNFTLTGGPDSVNTPFQLRDADPPFNSGPLKLGPYAVAEDVPSGWQLRSAICTSDQPNHGPYAPGAIDLHNGETVTCTFTNYNTTSVNLVSFEAKGAKKSIILNWVTTNEVDNAGFNVYRAASIDGPRTQIAGLIPSTAPAQSGGATYKYTDSRVARGTTYWYWLEDVDIYGNATLHGPVSAQAQ